MHGDRDVLLIKGGQKDWYSQVIFIPKENMPKTQCPVNLVAEAEKIIQNYMKNGMQKINSAVNSSNVKIRKKRNSFNNQRLDIILNICLLLSITFLVLTAYHFFV